MTATCFRCDWEGETGASACPNCGAPLYRPSDGQRRTPAPSRPPSAPAADPTTGAAGAHTRSPAVDRQPSESEPTATSARSVYVLVSAVFIVVVFLLAQGGPDLGPRRIPPPRQRQETGGVLVYAVADGSGAARLWRWDLTTNEVHKGPLVRAPLALVNVKSPSYGWLGLTSNLGNGVREASVLDSLGPDAEPEPLGRGDIVTWARQGATAVLVDRGPLLGGCRREVLVTAVQVGVPGRDTVLHDTMCGDVLSAGRTSIGYFLSLRGPTGVDVVGAGYPNAGTLLTGYGVIAISPGGEMLVTPGTEFAPAVVPTRPATGDFDPPPLLVTGAASSFSQFGGKPEPYLVRGVALRIDEVLAYAPGATTALIVGRLGGDRLGVWEIPLGALGEETQTSRARYLTDARGPTAAAYANDGTGFLVTRGRLWKLRSHRLTPLDVPEGAPIPTGPLVWIVREPIIGL